MDQGLFESITGHFLDNTPIDALPPYQKRVQSIIDHLKRMFNSRTGSIPHLKDYGLPDITEIYRKMPDGIEELKAAVKRTVEIYEPRLKNVQVKHHPTDVKEFRIVFILSGEMKKGGFIRLQTTFTSTGKSTIAQWKKTD